jgi:hypothetical protein
MGREGVKTHCSDGGDQATITATSDSRRSLIRRGSLNFSALIGNKSLTERGDSDRQALEFTMAPYNYTGGGGSKDVSCPRGQNSA